MLGLKWLTTERRKSICAPVLIEMKYGTGAYAGKAGIADQITSSAKKPGDVSERRLPVSSNQLARLGLVDFTPNKTHREVEVAGKPEVIFLLANNNPRSGALLNILKSIKQPTSYDLRFFVASFAGYAMHEKCMMSLAQFERWIRNGAGPEPA